MAKQVARIMLQRSIEFHLQARKWARHIVARISQIRVRGPGCAMPFHGTLRDRVLRIRPCDGSRWRGRTTSR
jgi:hypothetical protein